jgi:hypothetical protein
MTIQELQAVSEAIANDVERKLWLRDGVTMIEAHASGHESAIELALTDPVERTVSGCMYVYSGENFRLLSANQYGEVTR